MQAIVCFNLVVVMMTRNMRFIQFWKGASSVNRWMACFIDRCQLFCPFIRLSFDPVSRSPYILKINVNGSLWRCQTQSWYLLHHPHPLELVGKPRSVHSCKETMCEDLKDASSGFCPLVTILNINFIIIQKKIMIS